MEWLKIDLLKELKNDTDIGLLKQYIGAIPEQ